MFYILVGCPWLCAMWGRVGMHCEKRLELSGLGTFLPCENTTRVSSLAQLLNYHLGAWKGQYNLDILFKDHNGNNANKGKNEKKTTLYSESRPSKTIP